MEDNLVKSGEDTDERPQIPEKQASVRSSEAAKKVTKTVKPGAAVTPKVSAPTSSLRKKVDPKSALDSSSIANKSSATGSLQSSNAAPVMRRNSTGGLPQKPSVPPTRQQNNATTIARKKTADSVRRSLAELRRSSLPSVVTKSSTRTSVAEARKSVPAHHCPLDRSLNKSTGHVTNSVPASPLDRNLNKSSGSHVTKQEIVRKPSVKSALSTSSSSSRRVTSSLDSGGRSTARKTVSKVSSSSARSPTVLVDWVFISG